MSAPKPAGRQPYTRKSVPGAYNNAWLGLELSNIQRAMRPEYFRIVTAATDKPGAADATVFYDATGAAITVTLPLPDQVVGLILVLKKIDSSVHAVTLVGTIDGVVNPTLATQYKSKTIQATPSGWYLLASV